MFKRDTYIFGDEAIFHSTLVNHIDISRLEQQHAVVQLRNGEYVNVRGFAALELVWVLKPGALEGKRVKFPKYSWMIHNLIAHPLMQIIALFGFTSIALKLHDLTVPKPQQKCK